MAKDEPLPIKASPVGQLDEVLVRVDGMQSHRVHDPGSLRVVHGRPGVSPKLCRPKADKWMDERRGSCKPCAWTGMRIIPSRRGGVVGVLLWRRTVHSRWGGVVGVLLWRRPVHSHDAWSHRWAEGLVVCGWMVVCGRMVLYGRMVVCGRVIVPSTSCVPAR